MDEPLKHYAESKEQETKDHMLHDSIYMKIQNRQIHRDKKQLMVGWGREWQLTKKWV